MKKGTGLILGAAILIGVLLSTPSCKQCNPGKAGTTAANTDSTTTLPLIPSNTLTAAHADSSLIPILSEVLDSAFAASRKKDYASLASLIVYRGTDSTRHGTDVFSLKNSYEKNIVRITSDVFSKWASGTNSIDYSRAFEMPQPDGRSLIVLEVIFVYPKTIDRKFFGFLLINNEYKIADATSWL